MAIDSIKQNDQYIKYNLANGEAVIYFKNIRKSYALHAIAAKCRGAFVPELGFRVKKWRFVAYTKIAELERVNNINKINYIHLAGIFNNLLIAGIFMIISSLLNMNNVVFTLFIFINIAISLLNFSIYLESDGSSVLLNLLYVDLAEKKIKRTHNKLKFLVIFSAIFLNFIVPMSVMIYTVYQKIHIHASVRENQHK